MSLLNRVPAVTEGAHQGVDVGRLLRQSSFHPLALSLSPVLFLVCAVFSFQMKKKTIKKKNWEKFPRSSVAPVLRTLLTSIPRSCSVCSLYYPGTAATENYFSSCFCLAVARVISSY